MHLHRLFTAIILPAIFAVALLALGDSFAANALHPLTRAQRAPAVRPVTRTDDTPYTDTQASLYLPLIGGPPPSRVLIAAAHIDSSVSNEPDEAILLWNAGLGAQSLSGWQLATASSQAAFPLTTTLQLAPGQRLWCAAEAAAFRSSFGLDAACEWQGGDPAVLDLEGDLNLGNGGGRIHLLDGAGVVVDTLVYGDTDEPATGWEGAPAQLYSRGAIPVAGQVWQRKQTPDVGMPVDSNRASDWAGDLADLHWGRRVRFPGWQGWDAAGMAWPLSGQTNAFVTVAVGPEGLFQPLADLFAAANQSIDLSIYTLEHPELAQVLVSALRRGVQVRLLLEGSPPGGVTDLQRWCVAQLAQAGGLVRYFATSDQAPNGYRTRYQYAHAKFGVVDGRLALNGTDNFTWDSMPVETSEPVGGRRGYYLITDAPLVVAGLAAIFAADWAPDRFLDLHPYDPTHPRYGGPPTDFVLPDKPTYEVQESPFRQPFTVSGAARFIVVSAPENAMRPDAGVHALLRRAGAGDEILLEQLYEHKHWGDSDSNPIADPNVRLQMIVEAARRGARVRLILDSFFDEPEALRSNRVTADYVQSIADAESLDMQARLGNPTQGGIHAKLVLVRLGGEHWSAVGSLNGGEVSHKVNREVVILTDLAGVYERLAEVFAWDRERN